MRVGKDKLDLGDRRSYGSGRDSLSNRHVSARRDADRSQRSLLIGAGFFVAALAVIGLILFTGGDGDDDQPGVAVGEATNAATPTTAPVQSSPTDTNTSTATTALDTATTTTETSALATSTIDDVEPTATTVEESEPTATEEEEPVDEEPTATEEPDDAEPEPTEEEPFVGDFGILPPAQVVSGGLSRPLDLDYELAAPLSDTPSSATVYLLEWPVWTEEDVASIAANLGLDGEVEGGPGSYQVFGATSEIYFSGPTIQYVNTGSLPDLPLGDDASVIESASSWIYASGFISEDHDGGVVIGRDDDAGRAVVLFRPAQVSSLLSFVPSATVTVGAGGTVLEANIRWPTNYIGSEYGLQSGDALWNKILAGEGAIEVDLSGVSGSGALSGTMTVYDIWVAYSYAGSPGSDEFLVPLLVFSGEATINETGDVVPVSVYVSAVAGQATPQG